MHSFTLLQACAAGILRLQSPQDSSLPGLPRDKLAAMLFGAAPLPHVDPPGDSPNPAPKTKIQFQAEVQVRRLSRMTPSDSHSRDGKPLTRQV